MRFSSAAILAAVLIYGVIGLAEAGVFTDIITYFKKNGQMVAGQIPLPAFMFPLAIGIIGLPVSEERD